MENAREDWPMYLVIGLVVLGGLLWLGGAISALIDGHPVPSHGAGGLLALAHPGDPSAAWKGPVGGPILYWTVSFLVLAGVAGAAVGVWKLATRKRRRAGRSNADASKATEIEGLASRGEVKQTASEQALLRRAGTLRPSLEHPAPADVGLCVGDSHGVDCWVSVEDSIMTLGPPRSGKGLMIVIQAILNYPGAVITTSTRADNLTATMKARQRIGPVGVFDPQGLAAGAPSAVKWSPVRGCERPQTAMIRAAALCAGGAEGVSEGKFWAQQTQQAVRCLLHAAALGGKGPESLYEWSLSAPVAKEAVQILQNHQDAAPKWSVALDSIITTDPRQRDSVWAMVSNAFACLSDPKVLAAVNPTKEEGFDPARFLHEKGTLYLLGTAGSKEATGTSGLVSAFIEDVVDTARRIAGTLPGVRLDPTLGLVLDEAANYALPSLPALMSEGGGTGITTLAVLQSLAQARHRWGRDEAAAIWDSSIVKLILGGSGNADDLQELSRLIGERKVRERSESYGTDRSGRSWSDSERRENILDPSMIRQLEFGYSLMLLRSAKPIMLGLHPWIERGDYEQLKRERKEIESAIRAEAAREWGSQSDEDDEGDDGPEAVPA